MPIIIKNHFTVVAGIVTGILLIVAGAAAYVFWNETQDSAAIPEHLQGIGGDFSLKSADGPVSLSDFRGQVVMVFFGYTNCPDICPLTLSNWAAAFNNLSSRELDGVKGLFVSVDPDRDTPEVLKQYTEYFHPNITGVTGSHEELQKISALYRSEYHIEDEGQGENYLVDHMSFVYVIDRQGRVHDLLFHNSSPEDINKSLKKLL